MDSGQQILDLGQMYVFFTANRLGADWRFRGEMKYGIVRIREFRRQLLRIVIELLEDKLVHS